MLHRLRPAVVAVLLAALGCVCFATGYAVVAAAWPPAAQATLVPSADAPPVYTPTGFRVATYNALGASHTDSPTGTETWRLHAVARTRLMYRIFVNHGIDLAGVQEFQRPQRQEFRRVAGRAYGLYCPTTRRSPYSRQNCLVWRRAAWTLEERAAFVVPYFRGRLVRMPAATFRNRATGARVILTSVHNPCDCLGNGPAHRYRVRGWRVEAALAVALHTPTVLLGDRNARAREYVPHIPPSYAAAGHHAGIDWIDGRYLRFSGYQRTWAGNVRRATDHPLVSVWVTL